MEYIKVSIESSHEGCEVLADALAAITGGCQVEDPEFSADFLSNKRGKWDYIDDSLLEIAENKTPVVSFFLAADEEGQAVLRNASAAVAEIKAADESGFYGSLKITLEPMENQDWQTSWREFFKPFDIGEKLMVSPSWETPDNPKNRQILWIDPSLSFGTGTHATSRMCLEGIEGMNIAGMNVLDIGCGSGILACAALMLGAAHAVCCDIEEDAMVVVAENMQRNNQSRYERVLGDAGADEAVFSRLMTKAPYDIILANIVADVHLSLAGHYKKLLKKNGRIMLSGIISTRRKEVEKAFLSLGFDLETAREDEEWVFLEFSK